MITSAIDQAPRVPIPDKSDVVRIEFDGKRITIAGQLPTKDWIQEVSARVISGGVNESTPNGQAVKTPSVMHYGTFRGNADSPTGVVYVKQPSNGQILIFARNEHQNGSFLEVCATLLTGSLARRPIPNGEAIAYRGALVTAAAVDADPLSKTTFPAVSGKPASHPEIRLALDNRQSPEEATVAKTKISPNPTGLTIEIKDGNGTCYIRTKKEVDIAPIANALFERGNITERTKKGDYFIVKGNISPAFDRRKAPPEANGVRVLTLDRNQAKSFTVFGPNLQDVTAIAQQECKQGPLFMVEVKYAGDESLSYIAFGELK